MSAVSAVAIVPKSSSLRTRADRSLDLHRAYNQKRWTLETTDATADYNGPTGDHPLAAERPPESFSARTPSFLL